MVVCCLLYVSLVALFALDGSDCESLLLFPMIENEGGEFAEEAHFNSCYYQDQDNHLYQGKPSKCLLIQYLSLSIMHGFTSEVLQKLD